MKQNSRYLSLVLKFTDMVSFVVTQTINVLLETLCRNYCQHWTATLSILEV